MWNAPRRVVVAQRAPQPRGRDQQLEPRPARELVVVGRVQVAQHGVGDVGVDVEGGRAGRPVRRALVAADRPPRERGAVEAQLARALGGEVERRVAPVERIADGRGGGVGEHGQHEALGVPEDVPVVAVARQPLGGDRALLRARGGLQRVEEGEAHGLLELVVAVDLDVGALPVVVEVLALVVEEAGEPRAPRGRERGAGLVADRDHRALAGPAVGQVLGQRQRLAVADLGAHRHPREVVEALVLGDRALRSLDLVVHPRRHPQGALARAVHEHRAQLVGAVVLRHERRGQDRGRARVRAAGRHVLVGDEL